MSKITTVLKQIPDDSWRTVVKNEELALGCLPEEKALGVKYRERYTCVYNKTCREILTRCGLLSMLSSIYDPL